jgi:hypothetical protein
MLVATVLVLDASSLKWRALIGSPVAIRRTNGTKQPECSGSHGSIPVLIHQLLSRLQRRNCSGRADKQEEGRSLFND